MSEIDSGSDAETTEAPEAAGGDDFQGFPEGHPLYEAPGETDAGEAAIAAVTKRLSNKSDKKAPPAKSNGHKSPPVATEEEAEQVGDFEEPKEEEAQVAKPEVFELKANGKTVKVDTLEKLKAVAQRGLALQQKAETLETDRRRVGEMESQLKQQMAYVKSLEEKMLRSPEEFLRKHKDAELIAEKLLVDKANEWQRLQEMTPREQEFYQREKDARERLTQYEAQEKERQAADSERMIEEQKEALSQVFGNALKSHNLPANTTTLRVMAQIMRAHAVKGVQLTEAQAAQLTRAQLNQINTDAFGSMRAEDFVAQHPKLAEEIRKHYVSKAKGGTPVQAPKTPEVTRKPNGQYRPQPQAAAKDPWERELEDLKRRGDAENRKSGLSKVYSAT